MSAFHRMVTYLHLYDHDIKGRNIGFAKIAKRGKQCLIEIHMKNTGHSLSPVPVYFYTQKQQNLSGILLGNISLVRGNGDFKAALEEGNLAGSGYALEDVKGIFIPVSEKTMFVSQWDNDPFVRKAFSPLEATLAADGAAAPGVPMEPSSASSAPMGPSGASPAPMGPSGASPAPMGPSDASSAPMAPSGASPASTEPSSIGKASMPKGSPSTGRASMPTDATHTQEKGDIDLPKRSESASIQEGAPKEEQPPERESPSGKTDASPNAQGQQPPEEGSPSTPSTEPPSNKEASQNSLKAAEAAPKRNQAAYRNPFALPRFMPLRHQDFIQRPLPKKHSSKNAPARNRHKQIPPESPPSTSEKADTPVTPDSPTTAGSPDKSHPHASSEDWAIKWQFLLERYPVMTPFAGDEDTLCIRLELKDLRLLPQKYWYLGNNSFLLHGFFNYRHLILGITEKSGQKKWFIGIPGIFQNPERVMATLFGFPGFRNEKSAPINTGEFGYWYRFLEE